MYGVEKKFTLHFPKKIFQRFLVFFELFPPCFSVFLFVKLAKQLEKTIVLSIIFLNFFQKMEIFGTSFSSYNYRKFSAWFWAKMLHFCDLIFAPLLSGFLCCFAHFPKKRQFFAHFCTFF